ncbi:MAG: sigma-70 family RNA polymerase sigma factor [Prolixibacteraceae bacterium]|nr:sigma-70 family RNA polymerase sigma factor [Prolixibacteraceae bacterium]
MKKRSEDWSVIWKRFKEGDLNAFQLIYDGFLSNLYAYGSKLAPGFDLLDDCIQELFLEIYTHRKNLKNPENLEFYLLTALRRIIFHKIKKENRFTNLEGNLTKAFLFELELDNYENEDFKEERIKVVKNALAELNASQREILYLKFYNNLSYIEIGELLGVRPDSAKKQVYRIIEHLRINLANRILNLFSICFRP